MFETGSKVGNDERYIIRQKLGQGAFGAVYLAEDSITDTTVAIKTIPPEVTRDKEEMADLKRNYKLVHKLKHPHIAALNTLEFDKQSNEHLLIMEYVQGESLKACRKKYPERKMPIDDAVKIVKQLASAIDFAHQQSILHRDIKPENIIITANEQIKLLDFGLASEIRSTVLKKSTTLDALASAGTRVYMAPEQFLGRPATKAVDYYALGVLFYELVSGHLPFDSNDVGILRDAVCNVDVEKLEELNKAQNQIIIKALAKKPTDRYKTAKEFVDALEATLQPASSPLKFIIPGLAILGLVIGGVFYNSQQTPITSLFAQLDTKYQSRNIKNIALLPRFLNCNESIYETYKTKMVNQSGIKILERKMLSKVLKDQDIANIYNRNMEKVTELGLDDLTQSQAIVVGKCINNQLYMRLIESNTGTLLGASEVRVNNTLDKIATANTIRTTQPPVIEPKTTQISKGELKLSSIPSTVNWYMDGTFMGTTPSTTDDLEPGKHLLKLKKDGYQTREEAVMIRSGETTSLQFKLKQLITTGSLRLSSDPTGANWYMNNILMGTTPDTAKNLKAGRYEIQFKHEGYKNKEKTVFISKGKTSSLNANLTQLVTEFGLTVNTTPYDATVKILNINPKYHDNIQLKPGEYKVQVSKSGYKKINKTVWISDASKTISITLKKQPKPTTNSIYETVHVSGGCFQMGSNEDDDEKPIHKVCVDDFRMGKYEVTIGQYMEFVNSTGGSHPEWLESGSKYNIKTGSDDYYKKRGALLNNKNHPIMGVSWNNARDYAKWLSRKTGQNYSLPTEAEWEYACRSGGKSQKYCGGSDIDSLAWYSKNAGGKTHSVGGKNANGLGLYDMSGNVWEWTQDWYGSYSSGKQNNPKGKSSGSFRVFRGGSWLHDASVSRSANRRYNSPDFRDYDVGFRLRRTSN